MEKSEAEKYWTLWVVKPEQEKYRGEILRLDEMWKFANDFHQHQTLKEKEEKGDYVLQSFKVIDNDFTCVDCGSGFDQDEICPKCNVQYKPLDEITLKNGKIYFVEEDKGGETLSCFDTDDFNDVIDSSIYNMPIGGITINKTDIVNHIKFKISSDDEENKKI